MSENEESTWAKLARQEREAERSKYIAVIAPTIVRSMLHGHLSPQSGESRSIYPLETAVQTIAEVAVKISARIFDCAFPELPKP